MIYVYLWKKIWKCNVQRELTYLLLYSDKNFLFFYSVLVPEFPILFIWLIWFGSKPDCAHESLIPSIPPFSRTQILVHSIGALLYSMWHQNSQMWQVWKYTMVQHGLIENQHQKRDLMVPFPLTISPFCSLR